MSFRADRTARPLEPPSCQCGSPCRLYQPDPWSPRLGRPHWLARLTERRRFQQVCDGLRAQGCKKIVLYLWGLEFADTLDHIPHDLSIYNVSDEYSFSSTEVAVSSRERRLLESVGQVYIISPALMEKKGHFNPHTDFLPAGVDYKRYATPTPAPEDLKQIPHPRIGYLGHLKRRLDWSSAAGTERSSSRVVVCFRRPQKSARHR